MPTSLDELIYQTTQSTVRVVFASCSAAMRSAPSIEGPPAGPLPVGVRFMAI